MGQTLKKHMYMYTVLHNKCRPTAYSTNNVHLYLHKSITYSTTQKEWGSTPILHLFCQSAFIHNQNDSRPLSQQQEGNFSFAHISNLPVILRLPLLIDILLSASTGRPPCDHLMVGDGLPEALHSSSTSSVRSTVVFCGLSVITGGGLLSASSENINNIRDDDDDDTRQSVQKLCWRVASPPPPSPPSPWVPKTGHDIRTVLGIFSTLYNSVLVLWLGMGGGRESGDWGYEVRV